MAKTSSLRAADHRAIHKLTGECRDLGDDPHVWRVHFGAGLGRLTGAAWALSAEMGRCVRGPRGDLGTAIWGWENGFDQSGWVQMLAGFHRDPLYNPLMNAYIARLTVQDGVGLTRSDMIADRDWYSSGYYEVQRALGADATLCCFRAIPASSDEYAEVFLARAIGERDFSARARTIAANAMAAIASLLGGPLARFGEPSPTDLPQRTRQVLRCLLEGDGDKQIASRLGMSPLTVNVYTKQIFRHFGVSSRAQLLARWIRQRRGIGDWASSSNFQE
jgi:DNA-binding CsgD family transcriptional regulator